MAKKIDVYLIRWVVTRGILRRSVFPPTTESPHEVYALGYTHRLGVSAFKDKDEARAAATEVLRNEISKHRKKINRMEAMIREGITVHDEKKL
jgi:diketogulonate reductase-like aldo/keto reductase